jgi:hypothetical protein
MQESPVRGDRKRVIKGWQNIDSSHTMMGFDSCRPLRGFCVRKRAIEGKLNSGSLVDDPRSRDRTSF